jgi:hypothetical protein
MRPPLNPFIHIVYQSLKMVESEFNQTLPHTYDSILYYITNNYLNKVKGPYLRDERFGPLWALAFFHYRAGRKEDFYRCIGNDEILASAFE